MLLMVEKGIRGGICHTINTHAKAYNKSTYLKQWDVNNWTMMQKLPAYGYE